MYILIYLKSELSKEEYCAKHSLEACVFLYSRRLKENEDCLSKQDQLGFFG
jgi:hypothetical protein